MGFLLVAFLPDPHRLAINFKSFIKPKTAFFLFWILFFVVSHLWNFRTAPWNGNALFDESGWDLWYLKSYIIGHPYQAAWYQGIISRETLFHYYFWGFLRLFGFNILSYEAALFCIWLTTFVFTLLLVDLFFESYIVTSVTAVIFNFLPFAFIYTFAGYRYPMATALAVVSLYFLHLGFKRASRFFLSLSGVTAGLCLASSISGKQYLLALVIAAPLYAVFYWRSLTRRTTWSYLALVAFGFAAAAMPILLYIWFNRQEYTYYESSFVANFRHAMQSAPFPRGIRPFVEQLRSCFFTVPGFRFFIPDTLPIPLPYYWLLVPGFVLALWQKRFEIVLLATIPVVGAFIAGCIDNRLLMPMPFWMILISFTVAGLLRLRPWPAMQILFCVIAALILLDGLIPSVRYIYGKTKDPLGIHYYAQEEVAVSRFLKHVVAGEEHPSPPRLERDEFNRIPGIANASYDTLICQEDAYSIIHLFLDDYDEARILSFCNDYPFGAVMTEQDVWNANKKAILAYAGSKDLKLIWQRHSKTERIIRMFQSLRDLGTEDSISYSFAGKSRTFYVLNIPNKNIHQFQEHVKMLPATPDTTPPRFSWLPEITTTMFGGGKGAEKGQLDSPTGIAVDSNGNVLVADTGNGRIAKFSPNGIFVASIATIDPHGIAIDRAGNIYVAEIDSKHRVQKLRPDGTFIADWAPGLYGPRKIAIGPDDSIYVVDSGRNRIVKFSTDGQVLATWGSEGTGDGQFRGASSVTVDPINNKVYVADPLNSRIQVFDSTGNFLAKWSIPEWGRPYGSEDLAIDSKTGRLYASSAHMGVILLFDLNGTRIGNVTPKPPDKLERPAALALAKGKLYVLNMPTNRVIVIDL